MTSTLLHGMGAAVNGGAKSAGNAARVAHGLAHGITGGAMAEAEGGSFDMRHVLSAFE